MAQASVLVLARLLRQRPSSRPLPLLLHRRRLAASASAAAATAMAPLATRLGGDGSTDGPTSRRRRRAFPRTTPPRRWSHQGPPTAAADDDGGFCLHRGAESLTEAFMRYGHYEAQLDPLGLAPTTPRPELDPARYFPPSALDQPLPASVTSAIAGVVGGGGDGEEMTPLELATRLRGVYCQAVGFEIAHIDDPGERAWLAERIAQGFGGAGAAAASSLSPAERINAGTLMLQAEAFEQFLARKFPSFKRYSGEGAEAMQPAVDAILRGAHALGSEAVVIGMPHRGRLALLASQLEYPVRRMLHKVAGKSEFPAELEGVVDDVTSHIAASVDKAYGNDSSGGGSGTGAGNGRLRVSLLHNPSHLEIIGCVAAGKTRAKRTDGAQGALCLQIHGDAAVSGQGCIQETLALARLRGFDVGGTVHLVVNNQLGFTTAQGEGGGEGRSSRYCTDVAKMLQVPILHVNAEAVDEVILACKLAVAYRAAFGKDVFIDLHAYRLHGHNEVDEPAFTNPVTYSRVRAPERPTPAAAYIGRLVGEGLMTPARAERLRQQFDAHLEKEYEASLAYNIAAEGQGPDAFGGKWKRMRHPKGEEMHLPVATGVPLDVLHHIGAASVALPNQGNDDGHATPFSLHPRLAKSFVQARLAALEKGVVDWATAEALAVGSLLAQEFDVRLCGQDVGRGTFSQRHFLLTDQATGAIHCPLANVVGSTGRLEVVNSNLSELAVLGFEYGHSLEGPMRLGIWEAQFGDFANGAQIVVDTFLSGGESKWLRQSGLVLLLPHGQDGAGPEHSSARLERFLQLSNDLPPPPGLLDAHTAPATTVNPNLLVQHPTTPANFFHSLRRQLLRPCRKPLVVMAPKTLLRHPMAVSPLEALGTGECFQPVLASALDGRAWPLAPPPPGGNGKKKKSGGAGAGAGVKAIVFCSGKVYYDVIKSPPKGIDPSAVLVVRLEELAPFPRPALERLLDSVLPQSAAQGSAPPALLWLQEEPLNAGAWAFVQPHLTRLLQRRFAAASSSPPPLEYVGRPPLPTPAAGLGEGHKRQGAEVMAALSARLAEATS